MKTEHGLDLPRRLQIEFSKVVQRHTDSEGGEVSPGRHVGVLRRGVPEPHGTLLLFRGRIVKPEDAADEGAGPARARLMSTARSRCCADRNGPVAAYCDVSAEVGYDVRVLDYVEHALSAGGDARAAAYLECAIGSQVFWGVGIDSSITRASLKAITSAVNRAAAAEQDE